MPDIRGRQIQIGTALLRWSVPSVLIGIVGLLLPWPLLRGIALHALLWGAIDAILAVIGIVRARRDAPRYPDEYRDVKTSLRLRRILRFNGFLDLFYIASGVAIIVLFRADPFLLGNGIGVVIQAVFLLFFDFGNARRLPKQPPAWYDPAS